MTSSELLIGLATVVATIFGYFFTSSILPLQFRRRFAAILAPGIGLGFCSFVFFVFRRPMFTVEAALLLSISAIAGLRQWWRNLPKVNILSLRLPAVAFLLVSMLSFSLVGMILLVDRMPHLGLGWLEYL